MSSLNTPVWAIVPASGIGSRMRSDLPKQYLPLVNKTIIEHTIDRLLSAPDISGLILVLHPQDEHWQALHYLNEKPVILAAGGEERLHSVYNGALTLREQVGEDCLALVHDAVRPLVTHAELGRLISIARANAAGALLGSPVADTLKRQDGDGAVMQTVSRSGLWRAFTPQVFGITLLQDALASVIENKLHVTDDSSAVELMGLKPILVPGSAENIKITRPEDLSIARQIWLEQESRAAV